MVSTMILTRLTTKSSVVKGQEWESQSAQKQANSTFRSKRLSTNPTRSAIQNPLDSQFSGFQMDTTGVATLF
jgi:hypothetical protein